MVVRSSDALRSVYGARLNSALRALTLPQDASAEVADLAQIEGLYEHLFTDSMQV